MSSHLFGPTTGRPTTWGRIHPPDLEWLARGRLEEALDPAVPIVDAHHHLFDFPGNRYLLEEFTDDLAGGHRVVSTVHNECMSMYLADGPEHLRPVGETKFIAGLAARAASGEFGPTRIGEGIVGFADLTLGSGVRGVLETHLELGGGRFKGTRFATGWDDSPDVPNNHTASRPNLLADPDVRSGAAVLRDMGLTLDVMVFFHQLDEVAALADALPDLRIVVNHCGGPIGHGRYSYDRAEHFQAWEHAIRGLAERPNIVCKIGGVMARGAAFDYLHADAPPSSLILEDLWRPWFLTCIEAFGADRCMFESNFPVDKMGVSYTVLWNAYKRITRSASDDERKALFAGTAEKTYRLLTAADES
ncbi:amidohydrolase [Pseudarthrobacter sulfonivorans]|uniref:Amidohydrolase n=1 Tax=Pseudarthrobacter sulfonivorans TaxID=121292 RepID=A0A0U3QST2_9MICC|nr:amidohydrolase family protein [Pseudarthrobacter sulfonivorans]ALV39948.1 amidohydrolase [Pseudarthrobacter sulfonivorans]